MGNSKVTPYCAKNVLTSCAGHNNLAAMALHHVAVINVCDRVPTAVTKPKAKKSCLKPFLNLSSTSGLPEIRDEDLQRFRRQYGLWF